MDRKYLPTFAELTDRMSICILKSIFIPENKDSYHKEVEDIMHDLDRMCEESDIKLNSEIIKFRLDRICNFGVAGLSLIHI